MLTTLILSLTLGAPAAAQDPGGVHPPSPVEQFQQKTGQEEDEMVVLFRRVENRLREIDRLLFDASAGRRISSQSESGIEDLLKRTRAGNQEVLDGIDEILELAGERARMQQQQQQSGGSSGEGGEQGQNGQGQGQNSPSPLDQQSQGQSQRESTPEGPGQQPSGGEPQPQPGEQGQTPGEQVRPEGNQDSNAEPTQQAGSTPPGSTAGSGNGAVDGDARWGDLPVHVRELFRAQGGADMPPHYRDWIDAYYRRLNRKP